MLISQESSLINSITILTTQSTFWRKWTSMLTNCIWLLPILTLHMVLWTFRIILQPMIWPNWVQFAWKLTSSEQLYPQKCMNVLANRSMISIQKSIKREKGRDYNAKLVKRNSERPWSTTTRKWVYLKKKVNLLKTNKNSRILKLQSLKIKFKLHNHSSIYKNFRNKKRILIRNLNLCL